MWAAICCPHPFTEKIQMKIAVTATGAGLDAPASPIFGRSAYLVLVETETMDAESLPNPAVSASGGAGIEAAQFLAGHGVQAIVTGNVGPNAFQVLSAAQIPVYLYKGPTVQQAVETFVKGELTQTHGPSARSHSGAAGLGGGRGQARSR
jgi:predicted Fe-Mo cluster-binding NifX family protein